MDANNTWKRQMVAMAANDLARDHEFDAITVDMICECAGVSRSTFYRLFQDKYEILTWCESIPFSWGIEQMGRTLTCEEGIRMTLECFKLFAAMYLATQRSSERAAREEEGRRRASDLIRRTVEEHLGESPDKELDVQITWFGYSLLDQMVLWSHRGVLWGEAEHQGAEEGLSRSFASCCPARLKAILDNPLHPEASQRFMVQNVLRQGPLDGR